MYRYEFLVIRTYIKLTIVGSIPLLSTFTPFPNSNINLHKLHKFRPTTHSLPPEPLFTRIPTSFPNANESPPPFNRTLLLTLFPNHPHRHRRRSSRLRHPIRPTRHPLSSTTSCRHVCAPLRPHSSRRKVRLKHLTLRPRRGPRRTPSHRQSPCSKCNQCSRQEQKLLHANH